MHCNPQNIVQGEWETSGLKFCYKTVAKAELQVSYIGKCKIKLGVFYSSKGKQPEVKIKLLNSNINYFTSLISLAFNSHRNTGYKILFVHHETSSLPRLFTRQAPSPSYSCSIFSVQISWEDLSFLEWNPIIRFYFTPPDQDINMLHQKLLKRE